MSQEILMTCKGVSRRFGDVLAVDNLDLEVYQGECFALLGPNGAGKTTTMEMIEGLQRPDAGEIRMLGSTHMCDRRVRESMGVVLQRNSFPDKVTVYEVLRLFASFYKQPLPVEEILRIIMLEDKKHAFAERMSGGQQQRLALGCALIGDPKVLFLDEPSTGLDPGARREIWEILQTFKQRGNTVFFSTHYMEEAELLADRVAIMVKGKILALDAPRHLIRGMGAAHVLRLDLPLIPGLEHVLAALPSVGAVRYLEDHYLLNIHAPHLGLPAVMGVLHDRKISPEALHTRHISLEDVYLKLTGHTYKEAVA